MMPLNLANVGEETLILKVGGNPETRKHLEDLPSAMKWHAKS